MPHDLFWGLRVNLKKYFAKIQNIHSGVVNDYVLLVVITFSVVIVFCFSVL